MGAMNKLKISSTVNEFPARLPFKKIKNDILGQDYFLSLVFIGSKRALSLNQKLRNKSYIPNVLSIALTENTGEIYICPAIAYKQAKDFNHSNAGHVAYLFIHGALHLKGYNHGTKMEKAEKFYCDKYKIH